MRIIVLRAGAAAVATLAVMAATTLVTASAPAVEERSFAFGAVGDQGSNSSAADLLRHAGGADLDFFQSLGDLSYDTLTPAAWCTFVKDNINIGAGRPTGDPFGQTYPFAIVQGNHDTAELDGFLSPTCLPDRLGAVAAPGSTLGRDTYVDYPATNPLARIITTSPGLGTSYVTGSPGYQWLSQTIDQARASGIRWVVVGNHFNHITMGEKTSEIPSAYFDLLLAKRVDLILQSHDHTYQRSKQLAHGPGCSALAVGTTDPDCIADDGADDAYTAGRGSVLVIAGSGGRDTYTVSDADGEAGYFARSMGSNRQRTVGYARVTVSESSIGVRFEPTSTGAFRDEFRIDAAPPDTTSPSVPAGVTAQVVPGGVRVGWSAASDDRGVTGYRVLRDGALLVGAVTALEHRDTTGAAGTTYAYQVQASDAAGNLSPPSAPVSVTTPPVTPPGLIYADQWTGADGSAWPAVWSTQTAAGTVDVQGGDGRLRYEHTTGAYARAALTGIPAEPDTDLLMSYRWHETAVRSYLNVFLRGSGGWQNAYRPNNGYGLELTNASRSVSIRRSGSGAVVNVGVAPTGQQVTTSTQWLRLRVSGSTLSFKIWTDGTPEPATWTWTGTDTALTGPGQLYLSHVRSSASTTPRTVTIDDLTLTKDGAPPPPDTTSPSVPAGVTAQVVPGGVRVGWSAASDDRGVTGYRVLRDGALLVGAVTALEHRDTTGAAGTTYAYQVQASDAAGNLSPPSAPVSVTTPPVTPPGLIYADQWTGADGSAWPAVWSTQTAAGTVDVQGGDGRLRYEHTTGAYARAALTGIPAEPDTDLLMSYRWHETAVRSYLNVFLRGSGGWQNAYRPNNGYGLELTNASRSVSIRRSGSGAVVNVGVAPTGQQVTTSTQWLRLRVSGSTLSFKIWTDGTPEPATWTWTGTDTALTGPGQLYLSHVRSSASTTPRTVTIDDLTLTKDAP